MKTNYVIRLMCFFLGVSITLFSLSCKKETNENSDPGSMKQLSKDEMTVQNATDEVNTDVSDILSGGNKDINLLPCNVSVDSSVVLNDTITYTLTFNGNNCANTRHRQGTAYVKKHINTHWIDSGATVIITLQNLKVTRLSTGNWVILNGTKVYKNLTGGLLSQLGNGTITSVVHEISGTMNVTFYDNTTRTWQIARKRTFTGTPGQFEFTHEGFGSAGGYGNLVVWGVNRNGEDFYTQINQPVLFKQTCSWDPCAGVKVHNIPSAGKQATVTFGYDANQQPVSGNNCPTHYKLDWVINNNTGTQYLQLP